MTIVTLLTMVAALMVIAVKYLKSKTAKRILMPRPRCLSATPRPFEARGRGIITKLCLCWVVKSVIARIRNLFIPNLKEVQRLMFEVGRFWGPINVWPLTNLTASSSTRAWKRFWNLNTVSGMFPVFTQKISLIWILSS